jgi:hypothetical protein
VSEEWGRSLIEIYLSRVVEARAIRVCLVSRDFLCLLSPLFRFNRPLFINHHHPRHPSPAAFANTRQHRLTFSTNQPQQQLTTMSAATKKSASTKPAAKKSASKSAPSHPSWVDMIKVCCLFHHTHHPVVLSSSSSLLSGVKRSRPKMDRAKGIVVTVHTFASNYPFFDLFIVIYT